VIDKEVPGLVTFGTQTRVNIPADIISSRPVTPNGSLPQGRAYVFFSACGGNVTYHPAPPRSSGLPIRCVDPQTNTDLPAEDFVYGYTPLFAFEQLTNENPIIEGVELRGQAVIDRMCSDGCPADYACGTGERCLPVVPRCHRSLADDCPTVPFKVLVSRQSAELDPIASALENNQRRETVWVEYSALNGRFDPALLLVNDLTRGWQDASEGKFMTFKSLPGEATLFAVVRDNRGGQAFRSIDVVVR
jgi:hypothetical protein